MSVTNYRSRVFGTCIVVICAVTACGGADPVEAERYEEPDRIVQLMHENLASAEHLRAVADIDHSRLAHIAGSPMPPARVLVFSDAKLETDLIKLNPLTALDLPLRILTFEHSSDSSTKVVHNSFDYLVSRYQLEPERTSMLREAYARDIETVMQGIPDSTVMAFENDVMQPSGIVTIKSPFAFAETLKRVNAAIDAQDDTMHFGQVNFQATAAEHGIDLAPSYMILFGGPGPGGKAMANAPTLGLDGFCQKFLIWQDSKGDTFLSFNDLLALAERQDASKSIALRVINRRLNKTFSAALAAEL
ncbi:MAG: DUF302 domain-containing protein [Woeseiaceae bacterium]